MDIKQNFSLLHYNTFGIDAKCKMFIEYDTLQELKSLVREYDLKNQLYLHIGGGSNLLFIHDFEGLVLHSRIQGIEIVDNSDTFVLLRVGAGVNWDDFVSYCVSHNLYGAENLSYIPGEVGAAPVQNVGAYGMEAKDIIHQVEVVDAERGDEYIFNNSECDFGYRHSKFKTEWKNRYFVHHVIFKMQKQGTLKLEYGKIKEAMSTYPKINLQTVRQAIISIRKNKLPDPHNVGSAGSFFMNPIVSSSIFEDLKSRYSDIPSYPASNGNVKIPAGWLIEQCGWKGKTYKRVGVYPQQALILYNCGGATGQEVEELSSVICKDVLERFGITIRPEVCFIM